MSARPRNGYLSTTVRHETESPNRGAPLSVSFPVVGCKVFPVCFPRVEILAKQLMNTQLTHPLAGLAPGHGQLHLHSSNARPPSPMSCSPSPPLSPATASRVSHDAPPPLPTSFHPPVLPLLPLRLTLAACPPVSSVGFGVRVQAASEPDVGLSNVQGPVRQDEAPQRTPYVPHPQTSGMCLCARLPVCR